MKKGRILLVLISGIAGLIIFSCAGNKSETSDSVNQANNIRNYLTDVAKAITDSSGSAINSLSEWKSSRDEKYAQFIEMMGLQDMPVIGKRSELNVRITGTVRCKGYHIEKLYYESLPGLYVRANLYVPDSLRGPAPAILYVCGHARTQKVHYQAHPAKFARLGFVCLIIETIQYGEVLGEHWGCYARGWFDWYSRGYTPGGVEVWNAMRGLDLLSERPEVDKEKLGVTGISGGGAQSWFIAAADPRIKATAPVCGASTLEAQISARTIDGHCDCMMPVNTYLIDFQNIGALIAPRPLLIGQADRDGLNKVESVRRIYNDLKKIYALYDAPGKIEYVETPGGHSYHRVSREKIFSFFLEHLMGKNVSPADAGDIDESPDKLLSEEELRVYADGPPKDDRTAKIQDSFIKLAPPPVISSEKGLLGFRDSIKDLLVHRTFRAFPKAPPAFDTVHVFRTLDEAEFGRDVFSFVSEEGWRLKVDLRWRNDPSEKNPLMIVLRNQNENRWESEEFVSNLKREWNLAFFEVRGVGELGWDPDLQWHIRRASAWTGRTIASMQVWDVLRCMEFCRTLGGVESEKIGIAARDEMSVVALYASLLDGKCNTLILKNPPASQNTPGSPDGRGPAIEMLNCLRFTDVYQLPALLTPAEIVFVGKTPDTYNWADSLLSRLSLKPFTRFDDL